MISYKAQVANNGWYESAVNKFVDGLQVASIPKDPANTDYQQYLAWLAEGNTPEEA